MRKLLVSVAIATATLAAVPAAAQYRDHNAGWNQRGPGRPAVNNLLRQLNQVDRRVTRSLQRRIISPREAFGLRREANRIRMRLHIAARNGLNGREFANLQVQINRLEHRVRMERRDRDRRRG